MTQNFNDSYLHQKSKIDIFRPRFTSDDFTVVLMVDVNTLKKEVLQYID
jgi:hypothetical protein